MNKKRVQRLWREAGLKVPAKKVHKRRRLTGTSEKEWLHEETCRVHRPRLVL